MIEVYKNLGLVAIIVITYGLGLLLYKWPVNKAWSFSQHAAVTRGGRILYRVLFTISLPLLYVFMLKWFAPTFDLPSIFTVLFTLAVIGQLIAAYIPERGGWRTTVHNIGAFVMHGLLPPLLLLIAFSGNISTIARIVSLVAFIGMAVIWGWFLVTKRAKSHSLYFQCVYVALFFLTILSATYAGAS